MVSKRGASKMPGRHGFPVAACTESRTVSAIGDDRAAPGPRMALALSIQFDSHDIARLEFLLIQMSFKEKA